MLYSKFGKSALVETSDVDRSRRRGDRRRGAITGVYEAWTDRMEEHERRIKKMLDEFEERVTSEYPAVLPRSER